MIRIVIADDHPVVQAGLRALLDHEDDLTVVGEAASPTEAFEFVQSTRSSVVLMDLQFGATETGADAAGESAPAIAGRLMNRMRAPQISLSKREIEVLEKVAHGNSNALIASELFVSETTVKSHLVHIFSKLDVSSRTAAVSKARELGVLR